MNNLLNIEEEEEEEEEDEETMEEDMEKDDVGLEFLAKKDEDDDSKSKVKLNALAFFAVYCYTKNMSNQYLIFDFRGILIKMAQGRRSLT